MGIGNRPIEVLPNPVDTQLFRPFPEIPEQDGLIVFTGGLREKKGIRQLLQAMPKIVEKYPSVHLWIHGADTKDRLTGQSFLQVLKKEINPAIASQIEFRGVVSHNNLPEINACASVLVYPSWMETQGIVVIEGMSSAKPVVASQTGPGPELIEDGVSGVLCDPHNPDSIADALIHFIGNREIRTIVGKNARERAKELFSLDVLIPRNIKFYEDCLNG
jgi:glycosyltransferase involved in cell wall biosynthesis